MRGTVGVAGSCFLFYGIKNYGIRDQNPMLNYAARALIPYKENSNAYLSQYFMKQINGCFESKMSGVSEKNRQ